MLKRDLRLIALLPAMASAAAAQFAQGTYANRQFGYSVRYPAAMLRPVAGHSPEGQAFASTAGHAGFRVFAAQLKGRAPQDLANDAQAICPSGRPSYRVVKPAVVAVSCRAGDHIVYQKSLVRGDIEITVRGEYPASERGTWDPVVTSIARSMRAAPPDRRISD
jgi:hypothetical protein